MNENTIIAIKHKDNIFFMSFFAILYCWLFSFVLLFRTPSSKLS